MIERTIDCDGKKHFLLFCTGEILRAPIYSLFAYVKNPDQKAFLFQFCYVFKEKLLVGAIKKFIDTDTRTSVYKTSALLIPIEIFRSTSSLSCLFEIAKTHNSNFPYIFFFRAKSTGRTCSRSYLYTSAFPCGEKSFYSAYAHVYTERAFSFLRIRCVLYVRRLSYFHARRMRWRVYDV